MIVIRSRAASASDKSFTISAPPIYRRRSPRPAPAGELYQAHIPATAEPTLASQIVETWIKKDATAASTWVLGLPPGQARTDAIMAVVSNWTGTDPTAAGKWLQRFPAGAERDTAIGGFAYQLANRDPVLAFEWIGTVGDPIVRDAQYRSIVEWRMKADSDAARNWIESSDRIPDQLKAEVLKAQ